jgi:hypothetical protein
MMLFHVHPLYKWTCVCLQLCLHCVQSLQHDPSTAWQVRANSTVSVLSAPFSVLQFPSNSVSTLSVRYKLSRVGFVLMVPLLVLAVSFHGWVQLQRSCVSDPCNTLLLLLLCNTLWNEWMCVAALLGSVATSFFFSGPSPVSTAFQSGQPVAVSIACVQC